MREPSATSRAARPAVLAPPQAHTTEWAIISGGAIALLAMITGGELRLRRSANDRRLTRRSGRGRTAGEAEARCKGRIKVVTAATAA